MKSLIERIKNMSEEARMAILVPTIVLGAYFFIPLAVPNEHKLPRNPCVPAGWENAPKYKIESRQNYK